MAAPPAKEELSAPSPNPTNAVMRTGMGKLYDYVTGLLGATGNAADARTALGAVASSGGNLTGALNGNRMTVTAHATDTPIWADSGASAGIVESTGVVTVTDFPEAPQAGAMRYWEPAAGTIVTHGGGITVQGAANYTFASGDRALVEAITTTTFYVTVEKKSGTSVTEPEATPSDRQTVLSGAVDSSGFAAFGGSVGSATLTTATTLKATCMAGGDSNRIGSITNAAFTSPSGNGTGFMHLEIGSDGSVTTGVSGLPWIYQHGGTPSTVNGQHTVNRAEGKVYVGNGSTASQVYRVAIGECPHTSGAWSGTIVWYALRGLYDSGWFAVSAVSSYAKAWNLGALPLHYEMFFSADASGTYQIHPIDRTPAGAAIGFTMTANSRNSTTLTTSNSVAFNTSDSAVTSGYYRLIARKDG